MDLESYAFTNSDGVGNGTKSSDTPESGSKGKERLLDTASSESSARETNADVTFQQDLRLVTSSVSSWWSSFSEKSQQQLSSAQTQIAAQGGIVNFARNEAAKLEAQIDEVRRRNRAETTLSATDSSMASAKSPPPNAGEVDNAGGERVNSTGQRVVTTASNMDFSHGRLSSDARVASLQNDVQDRLSSLLGAADEQSSALSHSIQSTLRDVAHTLHQISGTEGKKYAQYYWNAGEMIAGKLGEDWKSAITDIVKVMPADGQAEANVQTSGRSFTRTADSEANHESISSEAEPKGPATTAAVPGHIFEYASKGGEVPDVATSDPSPSKAREGDSSQGISRDTAEDGESADSDWE